MSGTPVSKDGQLWTDEQTYNQACIDLTDSFNNKLSSAVVRRTSTYGGASGYWQSITASESLTFVTHYGFSYTHSESTTTE